MSEITHKVVTETHYSISLNTSNRMMPAKLIDFLSGFDLDVLGDDWHDLHEVIRDYEGDFEGIEIHYAEIMDPLFLYIAEKIGVDASKLGKTSIKITCI